MQSEHIVELHGSVTLVGIPEFDEHPLRMRVVVSHPGEGTLWTSLAYSTLQYDASPIPYELQLDTRTFEADETLDLEAILYAGPADRTGAPGAEKARVRLPLTIGHDIPRIEQDITLEGDAKLAPSSLSIKGFKRIGGTATLPPIEDLKGHRLTAILFEVHLNDDMKKVYVRIADNSYQVRGLVSPFSLHFDETVLKSEGTSYVLSFSVQAPDGDYVAIRTLRDVVPVELGDDMAVELRSFLD